MQLPEVGKVYAKGEEVAVIESVKTAGEIQMVVTGSVTEINEALGDEPGKVNEDPQGEGWFFKFRPDGALEGLMDEAGYKVHIESQG